MAVSFEGFPRTLQRSALRPGRWFTAADGARALLCFSTDLAEGDSTLALVFTAPGVEMVDVVPIPLAVLHEPFATIEDEIVFAPGQSEGAPMLIAPRHRTVRNGCLLRLASGDLGVAVVARGSGELRAVSLSTGQRSHGFELVFERWSLSLRRNGAETLMGCFKPHGIAERRRI